MEQCRQDCVDNSDRRGFIRHHGGQVSWLTQYQFIQIGNAADRLDGIIKRTLLAIGTVFAVAVSATINNVGFDRFDVFIFEIQFRHHLGSVVVYKDVTFFDDCQKGLPGTVLL